MLYWARIDTPMKMRETSRAIDKKLSVNNKRSTMRKYEISCAIIIQNMAQLETMYKESWKTIVGNCDEFIYLGGHESSSTEYVSKMLGKQTIKSRNSSRTYGRQGSNNISLNATGRELMTPDEIAHMSDQDCLVMVKGVMPFFDNKYDLTKHPNYKYTGDADDDLLFDVAAEIRTPNNKIATAGRDEQYRQLQREAKADARNHDRSQVIGNRRKSVTALNRENLENAGFNNLYDLDAGVDEEEKTPSVSVVGSHIPYNEFEMDVDSEAASQDNFNSFISGSVPAGRRTTGGNPPPGRVADVVCFGVKTTGRDLGSDEILQVSVVDGEGNVILSTYVKPRNEISLQKAESLYGIKPDVFAEAPYLSEIISEIQDALGSVPTRVSYNWSFNRAVLKAAGVLVPDNNEVDVMIDFAPIFGDWNSDLGEFRWQNLSTCAQYYGYQYAGRDSLDDAKAMLHCYSQMQKNKDDELAEKAWS